MDARRFVWSQEKESVLIDLVFERPCLWDPNEVNYSKKTFKKLQYAEVAKEMSRRWPEDAEVFSPTFLQIKFCTLRSYFHREQKKQKTYSAADRLYFVPKWAHYKRMLFLKDFTSVPTSDSSLDVSSVEEQSQGHISERHPGTSVKREVEILLPDGDASLDKVEKNTGNIGVRSSISNPPRKKKRPDGGKNPAVALSDPKTEKRERPPSMSSSIEQLIGATLSSLSPEDGAQFSQDIFCLILKYSSGTVAKEVEKNPISLEPTVEIKEEPADYTSNPSTSNDGTNEEFILPHENNSWTDSVVEPHFTLSVANLASPETTDGDQLFKKRKTNPANVGTLASSANCPEVRPQSPVYSFGEISSPSTSKEPRKDQFDVFGEYIAAKLRNLDRRSCAFAQRAIGDIIFEAEMGKYQREELEQPQVTRS